MGERVRIDVAVVGVVESQEDAVRIDERTLLDDLLGSDEPLVRLVPPVARHLVAHLVNARRSRRDADAAGAVETDFLQRTRGSGR